MSVFWLCNQRKGRTRTGGVHQWKLLALSLAPAAISFSRRILIALSLSLSLVERPSRSFSRFFLLTDRPRMVNARRVQLKGREQRPPSEWQKWGYETNKSRRAARSGRGWRAHFLSSNSSILLASYLLAREARSVILVFKLLVEVCCKRKIYGNSRRKSVRKREEETNVSGRKRSKKARDGQDEKQTKKPLFLSIISFSSHRAHRRPRPRSSGPSRRRASWTRRWRRRRR